MVKITVWVIIFRHFAYIYGRHGMLSGTHCISGIAASQFKPLCLPTKQGRLRLMNGPIFPNDTFADIFPLYANNAQTRFVIGNTNTSTDARWKSGLIRFSLSRRIENEEKKWWITFSHSESFALKAFEREKKLFENERKKKFFFESLGIETRRFALCTHWVNTGCLNTIKGDSESQKRSSSLLSLNKYILETLGKEFNIVALEFPFSAVNGRLNLTYLKVQNCLN